MMNGLLVESIVEAIVHRHAELVQTILVGSDIHLCATWQTGLDAAFSDKAYGFNFFKSFNFHICES